MWYCTSCGTANEDRANFCVECGQARVVPAASNRNNQNDWAASPTPQPAPAAFQPAPAPRREKSRWWVWLLVALAVLAAAAAICYFTIHDWEPATCTVPETCRICGRTRGAPLGHSGSPATCTRDFVCARCGELVTPALGHDWQPATYSEPETCSRCGETRGELKGWVGDLTGHMGSESLHLDGNGESHPYLLDNPVRSCMHLTLYIKLTDVSGNPYGTWGLYGRDNGVWKQIATFTVTDAAYNNYVSFDLTPSGLPSFEALSTVPLNGDDYSISYSFYYEDVQEFVG